MRWETWVTSKGRLVRRLLEERAPAGTHETIWDHRDDSGRTMPSGVYFYRLTVEDRPVGTQKVVVVK